MDQAARRSQDGQREVARRLLPSYGDVSTSRGG